MLTLTDIIRLTEHIDIKLNYFKQKHTCKGFFTGDSIILYMKNIGSEKDYKLTLLHELIHARNCYIRLLDDSESFVESEAKYTYEKNGSLTDFVKEIYGLRTPKF